MTPKFITLEGGEGAGKSTAVEVVRAWLDARGIPVVTTREPGGTAIGEQIRHILLDPGNDDLEPLAELFLMFAARAQHVARVVRPALEAGKWVLCDRFTDASIAYQGYGRGLGDAAVARLAALVHPDLEPDLTLMLDVPVVTGLERALGRGQPDRFEQHGVDFLDRVHAGYRVLAERHPQRIAVVDAEATRETVAAEIRRILESRLA